MIQRFAPLFSVSIQHSYYAGDCEDFEFYVPASTGAALGGGKSLVRVVRGRLHGLYDSDAPGVPKSSLTGRTLLFGLRLKNASFSNFTHPVIGDARRTPFYANANNPTAIDPPQGVLLSGGMHTHVPQSATRPLTLRLSDASGISLVSETLPVNRAGFAFDLRAVPDGMYRIDEDPGGGSVAETRLFVSGELRSAGVWALLAISVDAGFYAAPPALKLQFSAQQEQLKYFVVAKNFSQADFDQLNVTDNGFNEEGRPAMNFEKILPAAFSAADIAPALLGDGGERIVMFRSTTAVARRERGHRKVQLSRNGDVLIAHLPQPATDKPQAHFVIHLSKP